MGYMDGNTLLEKKNHPNYIGKKVAIIGGGNVAMDCARTIKKLGAKNVSVIYRRQEAQMPAEIKEIKDAKDEGIEFLFQNNVVKILGKDKVEKIECIKTELVKKDGLCSNGYRICTRRRSYEKVWVRKNEKGLYKS